ncbi:helix-turn-helix domain-containing protein, partial [Xanthovirga aplysinae]|uniref:helix-turn-helix domain-containing protein n=1 Tax=Xanthovirga aplysinae TaxID=2529853 RepID=UPI0012BC4581
MDLKDLLLFFFSALGAFNGLILGTFFLIKARKEQLSNYFLGALLIVLSVQIGKSVFFYFNPQLQKIFLQIGCSACSFIGPFLFLYLKSALHGAEKAKKQWKYHIIPLVIIMIGIGIIYPYQTYPTYWRQYICKVINLEWAAYIFASAFLLKNILRNILLKRQKIKSPEIWVLSIYLGNLMIICIAYNSCRYISYIVGALCFSFIFYLLLLLFLFRKKINAILFINPPKYGDKKIMEEEANPMFDQLEKLMMSEELYKDPNLKLQDVAKKLNVIPHRLSQLLNDNLGKNFTQFVNEYRIKEAKKLLQLNHDFTLEAIGYDCGFNSKSTFFATFKKLNG